MVSPLAPAAYPALPPIAGIRLAAGPCGIRYQNRTDLLLVEMAEGTAAAGVLTRSLTASAPVDACRRALKSGQARVLVVNSGNANAFTGKAGVAAVANVANACKALFGGGPAHFYMASTGVIGEKLADEKITAALPTLASSLSDAAWEDAARAIMTTDTYPKMATRQATIGGVTVTLNGIAKGSGMIAPDMATLLAFVFTDATIPATKLQTMLNDANERTFNAITVDGDTSTSDTLLLFATGKANSPGGDYADFQRALQELLQELSLLVVKDGEGAQKLITVTVTGAMSDKAAKTIGLSIANSPLVKTAIAAGDANWGRIVMAVGKAGERADRDKLCVKIGGISVARDGAIAPDYDEADLTPHMQGRDVKIEVDVGVGNGRFAVYTCDLTHAYIDINGSYRS